MTAPEPLIVRIGHADQANQQPFPPFNRLFEYADFFGREIAVHRGDTVNFQTQPFSFHIVALAADEAAARKAYPIIELNTDGPPAPGTGLPTISFGDGAFPVTGGSVTGGGAVDKARGKGPPVVGAVQFGQQPGVFTGGDAVEVIGPVVGWDLEQRPATIDQLIVIDAEPGRYAFFDMLHPGMRGTLTVLPDDQPASTQAEVDAAAAVQFAESKAAAEAVETFLDGTPLVRGVPGDRDLTVFVGASAAEGRVLINRIMPSRLPELEPGDRVHFVWANHHGVHTIGFAPAPDMLVSPFGFDCGNGDYQSVPNVFNVPPPAPCLRPGETEPKFLCDPGNAPSGSALGGPADVLDSGLLVGREYGVSPTATSWSVTVTAETTKGPHPFFDLVHPWMAGVLMVR
jgi:plastocyanin